MARKRKYGNKQKSANGTMLHSKKEAHYYMGLLSDQENGLIKEIELQPKFILQEKFTKNEKNYAAITYSADFRVIYADGRIEIIDVKGSKESETAIFKMKYKMFEYKFPDLTLKIEY